MYSEEMEADVKTTLHNLLATIGIQDSVIEHSIVAGQSIFSIEGPEHARATLNSHPDALHAFDYLVKKIIEKNIVQSTEQQHEHFSFVIDIDGKRVAHIRELETRAKMMADRARSFQYDVELSPMSAYERLIIHTALQGAPQVRTESQGEGHSRRVVIKYVA